MTTEPKPERELTGRQARFVREYLVDRNATQAAIRAGYAQKAAERASFDLLKNPRVQDSIAREEAELAAATNINAQKVLKRYFDIATADPRDIVQVHVKPCPACWEDLEPAEHPDDECKWCKGRGVDQVVISDTRKLTGSARLLFKGAKMGKYGVEIQMHDQLAALDRVAKHIGMFTEKQPGDDAANPLHVLIQAVQGNILRPTGSASAIPGPNPVTIGPSAFVG